MLELKIYTSSGRSSTVFSNERGLLYKNVCEQLEEKGLERGTYYLEQNGRPLPEDFSTTLQGRVTILPRVFGGKGGFGSMLRAIGAQIEKTTNREACRDLSGRRLRDINEEKRLKAWIEKQESREEEQVARKKRKLEKLCAVPKHEFKDHKYEEERSCLTDRVGDAIEEGFKIAAAAAEAAEIERKAKIVAKRNERKTIMDEDFDSDELSSSDDSDEDANPRKKIALERIKTTSDDAGSSEESRRTLTDGSNDRSSSNSSVDLPTVGKEEITSEAKNICA